MYLEDFLYLVSSFRYCNVNSLNIRLQGFSPWLYFCIRHAPTVLIDEGNFFQYVIVIVPGTRGNFSVFLVNSSKLSLVIADLVAGGSYNIQIYTQTEENNNRRTTNQNDAKNIGQGKDDCSACVCLFYNTLWWH